MKEGILNTGIELEMFEGLSTAQSITSTTGVDYRLVKEATGEYTLQGCFRFWNTNSAGFEWRDIATVNREDVDENTNSTQH